MLCIFLKCEVALLLHLPCTGAETKCHGNNICENMQVWKGMVALRNIAVATAVHTQGSRYHSQMVKTARPPGFTIFCKLTALLNLPHSAPCCFNRAAVGEAVSCQVASEYGQSQPMSDCESPCRNTIINRGWCKAWIQGLIALPKCLVSLIIPLTLPDMHINV